MMKYLKILSGALLIALTGGCGDSNEEPLDGYLGAPGLGICFTDSKGQDILTGIPTITWVTPTVIYHGDFISSDVCFMKKLFINDEEISVVEKDPMGLVSEELTGGHYKALGIAFGYLWREINDASNNTVYTVRSEIVCSYIFGNDEAHILTGVLDRGGTGGLYGFHKCWFDGVEASPTYFEWDESIQRPNYFIVRVDR
ncbi:MAG: hypothetical protein LBK65_00775 [Tannerellaceae bacterium]|jgi:hypothetical protein|nr:hypothetical protein [Tannerellaceae bacterium]